MNFFYTTNCRCVWAAPIDKSVWGTVKKDPGPQQRFYNNLISIVRKNPVFWIRVFSGSGSDFFPEFGSDLEKSGTGSVKNKRSKTAVQEENFFYVIYQSQLSTLSFLVRLLQNLIRNIISLRMDGSGLLKP